jgi:hypothetical protein
MFLVGHARLPYIRKRNIMIAWQSADNLPFLYVYNSGV